MATEREVNAHYSVGPPYVVHAADVERLQALWKALDENSSGSVDTGELGRVSELDPHYLRDPGVGHLHCVLEIGSDG